MWDGRTSSSSLEPESKLQINYRAELSCSVSSFIYNSIDLTTLLFLYVSLSNCCQCLRGEQCMAPILKEPNDRQSFEREMGEQRNKAEPRGENL